MFVIPRVRYDAPLPLTVLVSARVVPLAVRRVLRCRGRRGLRRGEDADDREWLPVDRDRVADADSQALGAARSDHHFVLRRVRERRALRDPEPAEDRRERIEEAERRSRQPQESARCGRVDAHDARSEVAGLDQAGHGLEQSLRVDGRRCPSGRLLGGRRGGGRPDLARARTSSRSCWSRRNRSSRLLLARPGPARTFQPPSPRTSATLSLPARPGARPRASRCVCRRLSSPHHSRAHLRPSS